ncbi:hypothetical protein CLF_104414 [Clonorchis sinensis]|uniref:Uncharacterized protein n=1 Tax=Clonorchis sinensis TaxID=79923 RepID=G7YBM1_CLOSI|nr:hypothetical protein CLF_104414 [Clonorchis sinensis]
MRYFTLVELRVKTGLIISKMMFHPEVSFGEIVADTTPMLDPVLVSVWIEKDNTGRQLQSQKIRGHGIMRRQKTTLETAMRFLQSHEEIHQHRLCNNGHQTTLSTVSDRWRCNARQCRQQIDLRKGTWLQVIDVPEYLLIVLCIRLQTAECKVQLRNGDAGIGSRSKSLAVGILHRIGSKRSTRIGTNGELEGDVAKSILLPVVTTEGKTLVLGSKKIHNSDLNPIKKVHYRSNETDFHEPSTFNTKTNMSFLLTGIHFWMRFSVIGILFYAYTSTFDLGTCLGKYIPTKMRQSPSVGTNPRKTTTSQGILWNSIFRRPKAQQVYKHTGYMKGSLLNLSTEMWTSSTICHLFSTAKFPALCKEVAISSQYAFTSDGGAFGRDPRRRFCLSSISAYYLIKPVFSVHVTADFVDFVGQNDVTSCKNIHGYKVAATLFAAYTKFEELVIAGPERRVYQSCSAFCWPYEVIGYARRICCRSSLCNANYETATQYPFTPTNVAAIRNPTLGHSTKRFGITIPRAIDTAVAFDVTKNTTLTDARDTTIRLD